jgi:hypothetical protein
VRRAMNVPIVGSKSAARHLLNPIDRRNLRVKPLVLAYTLRRT